ncbi:flagellar basal body P-ring protein FlgI [Endothiovibrio diazotrophicus]
MNATRIRTALIATLAALAVVAAGSPARAERVKDLATLAGVRSNQLVGYGLVVGLDGTGDSQAPFAKQSMTNMLTQLGVTIPAGTNFQLKNVAAVSVSAQLPPFVKLGQTIDITVSSIGDSKSLRGGALLMTPLKGADGKVYAVAQGNLVVGGFAAFGNDGSKITTNIPSVGRIPNGATVEREVESPFARGDSLTLNLHTADFTTAKRLSDAINRTIGAGSARALDGASVKVSAPRDPSQRVSFISLLENLEVDPGDAPAKVIINSRTGTVVIGSHVRVAPAAVSHGSLTVTISEDQKVSQPAPLAAGTTAVAPQSNINVTEGEGRMFLFQPGITLDEIVRAVNQVGAAPSDLVAILEALKEVGALRAELEVI